MDEQQQQQRAVQALLRSDVATSNIELVEYLIRELKLPLQQAWCAVQNRHAPRSAVTAH